MCGSLAAVRLTALACVIAALSCGCAPHAGATHAAPPPAAVPAAAEQLGRAYRVDPAASLLEIRAYRAGPLASLGHNHVIAAHDLEGVVHVNADVKASACELRIASAALTVDEPQLRVDAGAEFAAPVPQSARDGTRQNMLGEAVLNAAQFPIIELKCVGLAATTVKGQLRADVQASIRGARHVISLDLRYELTDTRLTVDGETPLKQTTLGITPFSVMLGALQVQDQLEVRIHLVAVCGAPSSASKPCA